MTTTEQIEIWKLVVTTLVTIAASGAVATLAYRQWRTAHEKLRLDLFDRRYNVFKAVVESLDEAREDRFVDSPLRVEASQSMFLFEDEVHHFIMEVIVRVMQAREWHEMSERGVHDEFRVAELGSLAMQWINRDAYGKARDKFMPYLNFKNLR